jgi:hypothetical protein
MALARTDITHTRRELARGIAGAGVAIALSRHVAGAVTAVEANGIPSGGIGLTRAAWEAIYGSGEATQAFGKYTDPTYGGPIYMGLTAEGDLVDFIEVQWQEVSQLGGIPEESAGNQVRALLPEDAEQVEAFFLPATPAGPLALRAQRWTSAALGELTGRDAILVIYQEEERQMNPGSPVLMAALAATIAIEDE